MPRVRKKPAGAYHHGDLRAAIVTAAMRILREEGPLELTVRRVSTLLGVTHAAVYHHFEDRTAMMAAVAEQAFRGLGDAIAAAASALEGAPSTERFGAMGLAYVRFALDSPEIYRVMFGAEAVVRSAYPGLSEAAERVFSLIRDAIAACQRDGLVVPGPPEEHTLFCWSAVHGFASLVRDRQIEQLAPALDDTDALAHMIVRRTFAGLGTTAAGKGR